MRILHTMIRVGNLERSIRFYTETLGMKPLRQEDFPEGKFTLAFLGYGSEAEGAVIVPFTTCTSRSWRPARTKNLARIVIVFPRFA